MDELQLITPRELGVLILKLQVQIEKKFSDDIELQSLYTSMIYKVFSSDDPKLQDMQQRLMNAWLYGMRHPDADWRKKFYKLYERNFPDNAVDRLNCLFTSIHWDACQFTNYISKFWFTVSFTCIVERCDMPRICVCTCVKARHTFVAAQRPLIGFRFLRQLASRSG